MAPRKKNAQQDHNVEVAETTVDTSLEATIQSGREKELEDYKKQANKTAPAAFNVRPGSFGLRKGNTIHGIDSQVVSTKEDEEKTQASIDLYQSYLRKMPLSGKVYGIQPQYDRDGNGINYYASIKYGPFLVIIPCDAFSTVPMSEFAEQMRTHSPDATEADAAKVYMTSRLGAEVDFIVSHKPNLDETGAVAGNRVMAMEQKRVRFWFGTQPNGEYLMNEGDCAEARVVAVSRNGIRIEIYGVETFIRSKELSWLMLQDATTEFKPGDRVIVRLMSITRAKDYDYAVEYEASLKRAQKDPREEALKFFVPGGKYSGTINYIRLPSAENPKARPALFVKLSDGVQCACEFPNIDLPLTVGTNVTVTISHCDLEKKFLFGKIYHISTN